MTLQTATTPAGTASRYSVTMRQTVVVVVTICLIAMLLIRQMIDYDIWWHLVFGEEILRNMSLPAVDRFTLLNFGRPLHDSHWLFQVLVAIFYRLAGIGGVELVRIGLCVWFLGCCYKMTRCYASPTVSCLLVLAVSLASEERFLPRPELVTFLMIALFCWRLQEGRFRSPLDLLLLTALQVLWVNAHGLFIIGPFLVGCYLAAAVVNGVRGHDDAEARSLLCALGAVGAACLVNPYGWGSLRYAWLLFTEAGGGASLAIKSVGEMAPAFGAAARNQAACWVFLLLLVLFIVSWIGALIARREEISLARTFIGFGLLAAALTARRNLPLFALVAAPLVAEQLALCGRRSWRSACIGGGMVALLAAGVVWSPRSAVRYLRDLPARIGIGISGAHFPLTLPATLDRLRFAGKIFNSGSLGGFYLFHGYPDRLPFYDGRMEAYLPEAMESVQRTIYLAAETPALWEEFSRQYAFTGVLLQHQSPEAESLLQILPGDVRWRLVYLDGAASFWLRSDQTAASPAADLAALTAEAGGTADWEQLVLLDWFLQRVGAPSALRLPILDRAAQQGPRPEILEALGVAQIKSGQLLAGEQTLDRLLSLQPQNREGLRARSLAAYLRGDMATAERLLERAIKLYPDDQGMQGDLARIRGARR